MRTHYFSGTKSSYKFKFLVLVLVVAFVLGLNGCGQTRKSGSSKYSVHAADSTIEVYAYRPPGCKKTDILVVFHGLNRKAELLRNKAVPIAQKECMTVFAPLFNRNDFPNWRYHRAGVFRSGEFQPQERWTGPILHALLDRLRDLAGDESSRLYLFGHSAGAQFLSRISAYSPPSSVDSIVIANPSIHVLPDLSASAPVGFAGLFSDFEATQKLKAYLALPISIYLGQNDTGEKYLVKTPEAMHQGKNRLERGRYVFKVGRSLAKSKGWDFNWKLIEVSDVGHSSKNMLRAPELFVALRLTRKFKNTDTAVGTTIKKVMAN